MSQELSKPKKSRKQRPEPEEEDSDSLENYQLSRQKVSNFDDEFTKPVEPKKAAKKSKAKGTTKSQRHEDEEFMRTT